MFKRRSASVSATAQSVLDALSRAQAMIEFQPDGTILTANENFLTAMGYRLDEIVGRHHSLFMHGSEVADPAYKAFWQDLAGGAFKSAEFARVAKGGRMVWIQASYNPVRDNQGRVVKVVKLASDITAAKLASLDSAGQLSAIDRSQTVIEFDLDGTIRGANANFCTALGYRADEIVGKHHAMFVTATERSSLAYSCFWADLARGEFKGGEFHRVRRDGSDIWIEASYNPVLGPDGKPYKVVKFAKDITARKLEALDSAARIAAIGRSMAVIEFDMTGRILDANPNFLAVTGYTLSEIVGQHHSLFCEPSYRSSSDYGAFWDRLGRGEFQAGEFRRIGKGGHRVVINASYNPILDASGKPVKVVKFATDITRQAEARETVQTMISSTAVGMEQLTASVVEISQNMVLSKQAADEAVISASGATQVVAQLTAAAHAMADITSLITSITGNINLLALNATIESARAGEAGRGFAVVANEVKSLAGQARAATERIGSEIANIQTVAGSVASTIDSIRHAIESVNQFVVSTSAAVEEQSVVTGGISASMQDAAAEAAQLVQAA